MNIQSKFENFHVQATGNKWMRYFTTFCRLALAAGFIPSGFIKIMGERFTSLSNNHPMGHYLEALYHTGYYYTFIGIMQVTAALLLLIPRTAVMGALLYFPIILNICILSFSVRFDGSLLSSPLMVLANLYLLCWYYDRWKFILPFNHLNYQPKSEVLNKFPTRFFAGAAATVIIVILIIGNLYDIRPRNTLSDCRQQCTNTKNAGACNVFCECIHIQGMPLNKSPDHNNKAVEEGKK